ncbi:MAG: AMP-binding protein [Actinomycetales bacterium]
MAFEERVQELVADFSGPDACAAELLCDRHPGAHTAFTIVQPDLTHRALSFGELKSASTRFAAALAGLGVKQGDTVATLMGKSAELVVALLAIWRLGAVHVPLFTAFASDAVFYRLNASACRLVIVDADQRGKLVPAGGTPQDATPLAVVVGGEAFGHDLSFAGLLAAEDDDGGAPAAAAVGGGGELVRLFTSGTTGAPKGVPVPLRAVASFVAYQEFGLDVLPTDVFWNAADPGWAYGLYFAILAPLAAGIPSILVQSGFSAELTWRVLERFKVTNFAAAPTIYRTLRAGAAAGAGPAGTADGGPGGTAAARLRHPLRRASSAGEPLTPDVIGWAEEAFGIPVRDHYGQTEHGMVAGNAWQPDLQEPLRPGSMGRSLPGWTAAILDPVADTIAAPGTVGRVAIDVPASPLMWFSRYANAPEQSADRFSPDERWYLTGDAGHSDADGYLYFSARDDDVIIMSGYRIGPFDVESVLVTHPAVAEAAVVGAPDELRGEVLEAFVVLNAGHTGSPALTAELQRLVKDRFAAHAYPRQVHYLPELPKTPSGKVQRYVLRRRR